MINSVNGFQCNKRKSLIVAELSANHGNSLELALETVHAFADAGADAIKVQTFRPQSLCMNINNEYFVMNCLAPFQRLQRTLYVVLL